MAYLSVSQTAEKWGISERSVRNYCSAGRIDGAFLTGKTWNIPEDAVKPARKNTKEKAPETLLEKYVPMGFRHFKIEGRTLHPLNVIESYVYYMTKPEYKDLVRLKLGLDTFRAR